MRPFDLTLPTTTRAYGNPAMTHAGRAILSVHLHRFIAPALIEHDLERVWVAVGFEGTAVPSTCFEVTAQGAQTCEEPLDFQALARAVHDEEATISLSGPGSGRGRRAAALPFCTMGEPEPGYQEGFLVFELDEAGDEPIGAALQNDLLRRVREAVRAARTNEMRMLFDEQDQVSEKEFLYTVLDRLPDVCGVDHSAALILTGSLEAMALDSTRNAEFEIVAERLYYDAPAEGSREPKLDRLVGLVMRADERDSLLGFAFSRIKAEKRVGLHIFAPDDELGNVWHLFGEAGAQARRFATRARRPLEGMSVLVPLLDHDELGEPELLGFLAVNYRAPVPIGALASQRLEGVATRLAHYLRRSGLFSLSARQLLLLEGVRGCIDNALTKEPGVAQIEQFIDDVTRLVDARTRIPCIAVGYVTYEEGTRRLRFAHARGFTRFGDITLAVDDLADVHETSIASLAVRLARPVVLAGGGQDDGRATFNNDVFVHEQSGQMVDARRVDPVTLEGPGWRRLSDYYKPSREASYATLAFPVVVGGEALGVISVEVDRETDWFWWTGFGSQLFYRLLANEVGLALKMFGVPVR